MAGQGAGYESANSALQAIFLRRWYLHTNRGQIVACRPDLCRLRAFLFLADMKLSPRHKQALALLRESDMTLTALADRLGVHPYSASRIVQALVQAGLVGQRGWARLGGRGRRPALYGAYAVAPDPPRRPSSSVVCVKARSDELASALDLPVTDQIVGAGWDFERRAVVLWIERGEV